MQYNKLDESAKGVYIISATPFKDNGALDIESTKKLMDFYIEKGVDGITVLGVMGEAPKLTAEESKLFLDTALKQINKRVPVIVGVSNPASIINVVVFPEPEGPSIVRNSPFGISTLRSLTTSTSPS